MCNIGFIKIDRKILDWEWYKNTNTKILFLHCLLKANWKEGKFEGHAIPRGSFVSSVKKLSVETTLSEMQIRTALKHLKLTGELTSKTTGKFTVFTVKNYNLYQLDNEHNNEQVNAQTNEQVNKQVTTIEEYKERKKEEYISIINNTLSVSDNQTQEIVECWNQLEVFGIKPISRLCKTSKRYKNLVARIKEYGFENIIKAIGKIKDSDFCHGKNNRGWTVTFDWFVLPSNFPKVLEGNYDNRDPHKKDNLEKKSKKVEGNTHLMHSIDDDMKNDDGIDALEAQRIWKSQQ